MAAHQMCSTFPPKKVESRSTFRVSVQGVKSLCGHFAFLCRGFEFYEVKKKLLHIIFQKENGNTFTLLSFNHFYSEKSSKGAK
jgi:hypothetical protein